MRTMTKRMRKRERKKGSRWCLTVVWAVADIFLISPGAALDSFWWGASWEVFLG